MKNQVKNYAGYMVILIIGLVLGLVLAPTTNSELQKDKHADHGADEQAIWTCSMHPQIQQPEPGQCPICGMDLIPLNNQSVEMDPQVISMSPTAMQLASVTTQVVTKSIPKKEMGLNGKVVIDQRKLNTQVAHIPGRIEQLLINFTGEQVVKGQVLAYVYSPELVSAQKELFEAQKVKNEYPELLNAAKQKLKNWKLTDQQVHQIITGGEIIEQFPILADHSGIVTNQHVNTGDYVKKGKVLFELADLQRVWVLLDVYEKDLPWVKLGDQAKISLPSIPSEKFNGSIRFIDPVIDPKTRVSRARVELDNTLGKLKPEMLVRAKVVSQLNHEQEVVQVPKTAVMWTGKRSIVYVKRSSVEGVGFIMREVTLGPDMGDVYIVNSGIEHGEEIAVSGTFSIDAAAQLMGKPSMMNPDGGKAAAGHSHSSKADIEIGPEAMEQVKSLFATYLPIKRALVKDDLTAAAQNSSQMQELATNVDMSLFEGEAHMLWMNHQAKMSKALDHLTQANDLDQARTNFSVLSQSMITLVTTFNAVEQTTYVQYCPMANSDAGGSWLSTEKAIQNPFFGIAMLKCGEIKDSINPNK